jgi:hypothetical protein
MVMVMGQLREVKEQRRKYREDEVSFFFNSNSFDHHGRLRSCLTQYRVSEQLMELPDSVLRLSAAGHRKTN